MRKVREFDLQGRLIDYAVRIIALHERMRIVKAFGQRGGKVRGAVNRYRDFIALADIAQAR